MKLKIILLFIFLLFSINSFAHFQIGIMAGMDKGIAEPGKNLNSAFQIGIIGHMTLPFLKNFTAGVEANYSKQNKNDDEYSLALIPVTISAYYYPKIISLLDFYIGLGGGIGFEILREIDNDEDINNIDPVIKSTLGINYFLTSKIIPFIDVSYYNYLQKLSSDTANYNLSILNFSLGIKYQL